MMDFGRAQTYTLSTLKNGSFSGSSSRSSPQHENRSIRAMSDTVTESTYNDAQVDQLYIAVSASHGNELHFRSRPILNPPPWLRSILISPWFMFCEVSSWLISLALYSWSRKHLFEYPATGLVFALPITLSVPVELCFLDRRLVTELYKRFHFWFLVGVCVLHALFVILNYTLSPMYENTPQSQSVWRSLPVFLIAYLFTLHLDAYVWRLSYYGKIVILTIVNLNGIRWFVYLWLVDQEADDEGQEYRLVSSMASFGTLSRSAFFTLHIFLARLLYRTIRQKEACMLLDVRLRIKYALVPLSVSHDRGQWSESAKQTHSHHFQSSSVSYTTEMELVEIDMKPEPKRSNTRESDGDDLVSLVVVDKSTTLMRCSERDVVLRIGFLNKIGRHKYYPPVLGMWLFVVGSVAMWSPDIEWYYAFLCAMPSIPFVLIEFATRVNRRVVGMLIATFEFHYIVFWVWAWGVSVLIRASSATTGPTGWIGGFNGVQILVLIPCLAFWDAYTFKNAALIKRVVLVLCITQMIAVSIWAHVTPPEHRDLCYWVYCTDTSAIEQNARTYLLIFSSKYLFIAVRYPRDFLMLTSPMYTSVIHGSR